MLDVLNIERGWNGHYCLTSSKVVNLCSYVKFHHCEQQKFKMLNICLENWIIVGMVKAPWDLHISCNV